MSSSVEALRAGTLGHKRHIIGDFKGAIRTFGSAGVSEIVELGHQGAENDGRWSLARKRYEDLLALLKDADPDIPILKQAKAEYATLR